MKKLFIALAIASLSVLSAVRAATIAENFSADPSLDGWQVFGNTNQFQWDSTNQNLDVTWDSSRPNSYFYHPLGTTLTRNDDFSLAFTLSLTNFAIGTDSNAPSTFELAIGFINLADATNSNFLRGVYPFTVENLVEFDFFPADPANEITATVGPTIFFTNSDVDYDGDTYPLSLDTSDVYQIQMTFTASNQTLVTVMTDNGQPFGPVNSATLPPGTDDFRLDQVAIMSYSDAGQNDPMYGGSIFAQGTVGNFVVTVPPPPIQNFSGGFTNNFWQVQFISQTNWLYTLQRSADLQTWTCVSNAISISGNGTNLFLQDTNAISGKSFYRIRADLP